MSEQSLCVTCQKSNAPLECGVCKSAVCKNCADFLAEDAFQYIDERPVILNGLVYCQSCYLSAIAPEIENYNQILAQAEDVRIFDRSQTKETRLMKRNEKPLQVKNCLDPQEATMKLAYLAALKNFNAIIDVDIKTTKIRDGSYQTSECSGIGFPTNISNTKIERDRKVRGN